jgi:hypothetical protein
MPEMELENHDVQKPKKQWQILLDAVSNKSAASKKIGVDYNTLRRWINGEHTPRIKEIVKIAQLDIPGIEEALREEFPDAFEIPDPPKSKAREIPSGYWLTIVGIRATVASLLLQYTVFNHVYEYIVSQLDPANVGLMLLFVECVRPAKAQEKISQLCVLTGRGTSPLWDPNPIEHTFQIGKGSLCGIAVTDGHPTFYPQTGASEIDSPMLYPDRINSAAAFPITFCGDYIAGVLFVASIDIDFFTLDTQNLLRGYATMIALGLKYDQFYAHNQIELK